MDFLPSPQSPSGVILVPDLGGEEYDGGDFQSYANRCGWDVQKLRQGETAGGRVNGTSLQDIDAAAQFLQTWLFFGTLCEMFGRTVRREEYTCTIEHHDGTSKSYISTKQLQSDIAQWASDITRNAKEKLMLRRQSFVACLNTGAMVLNDLSRNWKLSKISILPMEVHLSLSILMNWLNFNLYQFQPIDDAIYSAFASTARCSAFEAILLDQGWCPNLITRLCNQINTTGLYYAYIMGPPAGHYSHDSCTEDVCIAYNVDTELYTTKHLVQACRCEHVVVPTTELSEILSKDQIPLVHVSGDDDQIDIHLVPSDSKSKYVAISHVWADGLGNPFRNSLPRCQLRAIRNRLSALDGMAINASERLLWMDTLCVPVSSEGGRSAAILAMRKTYEEAEAVLVLDEGLLSVRVPPNHEESLVRILRGNWMSRLWTLQEAALASRLFFQFADQSIEFDLLQRAASYDIKTFDASGFFRHRAAMPLQRISRITTSVPTLRYKYPLAAVWSSLKWRSTTKARDIPVCIATLIGSDVSRILKAVEKERMEAFWASLSQIPSSIIWTNGPRLSAMGFRWAPKNLLNFETLRGPLVDDCTPASYESLGLVVSGFPAYQLFNTWIPEGEKDCFKFYCQENEQTYNVFKCTDVGNGTWEQVGLHEAKKPALLVQNSLGRDSWISGILVDEYVMVDGTIRTKWLAQVAVYEEGGLYDGAMGYRNSRSRRRYTKMGYQAALDPETGQVQVAWGKLVSREQKWLIS